MTRYGVILLLALTVCGTTYGQDDVDVPDYEQGGLLREVDFESSDDWTETTNRNVSHFIEGGEFVMQIRTENFIAYSFTREAYTDTIAEVELLSVEGDAVGFGLVCRFDPTTDAGYYFLADTEERYGIEHYDGRDTTVLAEAVDLELVDSGEVNSLRVVCVGDYLALYINDELALHANDNDYDEGALGLASYSGPEGESEVVYDNLVIYEAETTVATAPTSTPASEAALPEVLAGDVVELGLREELTFTFQAQRGDTLLAFARSVEPGTVDPLLFLYREGEQVAANDDHEGDYDDLHPLDALLEYTVTDSGAFTLELASVGGRTAGAVELGLWLNGDWVALTVE